MNYENFTKVLDSIRKIENFMNTTSDLGVDMYETDLYDGIITLEAELFTNAYTKDGYEWISWYLFELPDMKNRNEDGKDYAWDDAGNPIKLDTDRDLWLFLERDYVNGD